MSVPELRPDDETGVIYMHWTEPGIRGQRGRSKRQSTRTRDMDAAKAYLGEWLLMEKSAPADGRYEFTVAELWAVYKAKHLDVKAASQETARFTWANLEKHFGALAPAAIDQDVVDAYEAKRAKGQIAKPSKPATVRRELLMLLACLRWCAAPRRSLIAAAAVPDIDLPAEGESKKIWLRREQMDRLHAAATQMRTGKRLSRAERFLWLALETAARKTAIYQLTWSRVDFETGMIDYDVPGRRKTKKRRAQVPISDQLRVVLERAFAERTSVYVLDHQAEIWSTVQSVARRAGFGPEQRIASGSKPKATGVSPHVLRHTAATYMLLRGVPPWTVAGILGNSEEMVREVYGHLCNEAARDAVAKISGPLQVDSDMALLAAIKSGKFKLVEVS